VSGRTTVAPWCGDCRLARRRGPRIRGTKCVGMRLGCAALAQRPPHLHGCAALAAAAALEFRFASLFIGDGQTVCVLPQQPPADLASGIAVALSARNALTFMDSSRSSSTTSMSWRWSTRERERERDLCIVLIVLNTFV
jgi:hypothetical protein